MSAAFTGEMGGKYQHVPGSIEILAPADTFWSGVGAIERAVLGGDPTATLSVTIDYGEGQIPDRLEVRDCRVVEASDGAAKVLPRIAGRGVFFRMNTDEAETLPITWPVVVEASPAKGVVAGLRRALRMPPAHYNVRVVEAAHLADLFNE